MKSFLKTKKAKRLLIVGGLAILVVIGMPQVLSTFRNNTDPADDLYTLIPVEKRDITVLLSGTGTLKPADSYIVTTLASGDVVQAPFEEGDIVEKDALLYEIDSSNVNLNIETAEISLEESKRSYSRALDGLDKLKIESEITGTVYDLSVEVGDSVQPGQTLGAIRNQSVMSLSLPFGSEDSKSFSVGSTALVTVSDTYETIAGIVTEISPVTEVLPGGMIVNQVTIEVNNPGGLKPSHRATAKVNLFASYSDGSFNYKEEGFITSTISGDVEKIHVNEGDSVSKGTLLIELESTQLEDEIQMTKNNLRRSEINLNSQYDALENYRIVSPIGGTVIEKNFKEGDKLETGKPLATIFDLSYLTMTLYIDELDIQKISVGQPVSITAEAVEDKVFSGEVTKVNINGITSGGTTTYPVTIQINKPDGLLPGMNVDAEIVIESKSDVLAIPSEALLRGDRVLVKASPDESDPDAPAGYKFLNVKPGIADLNYIEILEGLALGDEVAIEKRVARDSFTFGRPPQGGDPFEGEVDQP